MADLTKAILGIRAWLDTDTGTVSRIFTRRNDLDFKGAKIGDKTKSFEAAFGKPVSDQNGYIHFKYENGNQWILQREE